MGRFVNTRLFSPVVLDGITQAPEGTYEFVEWWSEQYRRCLNGYTVGDTSITGTHYFYLNFWEILAKAKGESRKRMMPPRFLDIDYDFFWAWERAKVEGKDLLVLKRRQTGFTNKYAVVAGHEFSFVPDSYVQIICSAEKYATNAFKKVRSGLDRLAKTEFYKRREGANSDTASSLIAQFVETVNGRKQVSGYNSQVEKFVSDGDEQALIGASPAVVIFDEIGVFPGFLSVKNYIEPGMMNEGVRTGNCLLVGTGGEVNDGIRELSMAFYNPATYNILEFDRDYDNDLPFEDFAPGTSGKKTAMFIPGYKYEIIDEDGNSMIEESYEKLMGHRKRLENDEKRYLEHITQFPFTPEEALLTPSGSRFNIKKLRDQLIRIRKYGGPPIQRGDLDWATNEKGQRTGTVDWTPNPLGKYRVIEHPMIDPVRNVPYDQLYVAGTDSYDRDKAASKHGSFGAQYIFKRFLNAEHTANLPVAGLYERPDTSAEFYEDTAKLCVYYGAINLVEYSNLLILEWYKQNGFEYLLKERPEVAYAATIRSGMENRYGIDPATKPYWIQSLADYINTNADLIWDPELLEALIDYREDDKNWNCDRTIALSLCMVFNNDILHQEVLPQQETESTDKRWKYVRIGGRIQKVFA